MLAIFFQLLRPAGEIGYYMQATYALLEQMLMMWPNGQAPARLQIPGATLGRRACATSKQHLRGHPPWQTAPPP